MEGTKGQRERERGREKEKVREREVKLAGSARRFETRVQGQSTELRTGKSGVGEPGGPAGALPGPPALEAARDAPSHKLHDSEPVGSLEEEPTLSRVAPTRGGASKRCGRVSAGRPSPCLGIIRQGREPTDRLVKSRPGRRYRRATSRASPFPLPRRPSADSSPTPLSLPPPPPPPPPPLSNVRKPVHTIMTRKAARFINQGVRGGASLNHSAPGY